MLEALFPSFLLTFREALDPAMISSIIVASLRKREKPSLKKYDYYEAGGVVISSLILGTIIFLGVYGSLDDVSEQLFEGDPSLRAVIVLTYMIFWMSEHSNKIRGNYKNRLMGQ